MVTELLAGRCTSWLETLSDCVTYKKVSRADTGYIASVCTGYSMPNNTMRNSHSPVGDPHRVGGESVVVKIGDWKGLRELSYC
jgi:hypothetical protein